MNSKSKKKWFFPALLIIIGVAFALRWQICRELKNADLQVVQPSVYTDMYTYKLYSEQIVKGEYKQDFYYQPFYYAVFLPCIKQIFGFGIWPVIMFQLLLSVATIWLSAMVSSRLWGRRSGIITALLLTFSSILILYIPYHLIATLQAFWVALIAFMSVQNLLYENNGKRILSRNILNWSFLGFVLSLGILTRGNIWFFVPGVIAASVIARFKYAPEDENLFKKFLPVLFLMVMIIIPQIPFAWKNTQITGKLSGPSTATGSVLSLGNTPESPPGGRDAGMGPGPMEYPMTCRYWGAKSKQVSVLKQMWDWFYREPLAFAELQWRKMLLFWDRREIPNNIAVEHQGLKSRTWQLIGLIPGNEYKTPRGPVRQISMNLIPASLILLTISMAGLFLLLFKTFKRADKDDKTGYWKVFIGRISGHLNVYLLGYFILAYWLGTAAFYILARFRVPVIPLLAIFAGGFLQAVILSLKHKKRIAGKVFSLVISLVLVTFGYDFYRYVLEATVVGLVRPHGVISPMGDELLVMDNGPYSFGYWRPIELKQNIPLVKKFDLPDIPHGEKVRFMVEIIWDVPGKMMLEVNGREYLLKEASPIRKLYEFYINADQVGKITLIPKDMDCRVFVVVDFQRDYGRTSIDGNDPGGELVSQLLFAKE